jgi:hypothetical protein
MPLCEAHWNLPACRLGCCCDNSLRRPNQRLTGCMALCIVVENVACPRMLLPCGVGSAASFTQWKADHPCQHRLLWAPSRRTAACYLPRLGADKGRPAHAPPSARTPRQPSTSHASQRHIRLTTRRCVVSASWTARAKASNWSRRPTMPAPSVSSAGADCSRACARWLSGAALARWRVTAVCAGPGSVRALDVSAERLDHGRQVATRPQATMGAGFAGATLIWRRCIIQGGFITAH